MRLKREAPGAFCVLNANAKSQTRKSMKINVICTVLLPDTKIGKDGFHDVVLVNLIGSSTWRSRHVSPSDIIALRQRWPRAVFQMMKERSTELEDLRRQVFTGLQWAYRYAHPGYCPECKTKTDSSLESHMMCCHLGLGQLWRCPVEWCAMWKGSVRECRDHFISINTVVR